MAKKTTQELVPAGADIQMYSGVVRLYEGPGFAKPVEDMAVERFPATSKSNAHLFLINAGRQWLDDAGHKNSGSIEVLYCGLDGVKETKPKTPVIVGAASKPRYKQPPAPVANAYTAFKCPIVSLCKVKFSGKFDHTADTMLIQQEK